VCLPLFGNISLQCAQLLRHKVISTIFRLKDSNRAQIAREKVNGRKSDNNKTEQNMRKYKYAYDKCDQGEREVVGKGEGKRTRQKETDTLEGVANRFKISNHI